MVYLYRFLAYHKLILLILQIIILYIGRSTPFYYLFTILLLLFFLSNYPIKIYTNKTSLLIKIIFAPWLKSYATAKKSSWRAVVVMRWTEVIYQEVNKSRLTDHFNKIPGREKKRVPTIDFKAFVHTFFLTVVY